MYCILYEHELHSSESQVLTVFCLTETALCVCVSCQPYFVFNFCYLLLGLGMVVSTPGHLNLFLARRQCELLNTISLSSQ